jgi:hypothetical protein
MGKRWHNISIPGSIVDEINKYRPEWMSLSEFSRNAINFYLDAKYRYSAPTNNSKILEAVQPIE